MEAAPVVEDAPAALPTQLGGKRLRGAALAGVLAGLMLTLLLAALDQTIVSTALPTIIGELHGFSEYTWVVTAYLLTSTTVIPIVGKLSDQFGRKWFLVAGVVTFLVGSALSGASQTMTQLILFRGFQGIGGGMLISLVFTLVGDIFAPAERARWQGLFSGVFALASVIGPTLGGWITDNTSWRWVFYVNLPIGAIALFVLIAFLPTSISVRTTTARGRAALRRIDFAGAFTAAGGTICLLLGLTWGGTTYAWSAPQVIGILAAAAVLLVAFLIVEWRFANEPILPLDLFKNQVFAAGALLSFTVGLALFAVVIYLPLFIQAVLGLSAVDSGAAVTPLTLTLAIGAAAVGQLIARIGRYQILSIIGSVILAFGIYLLTRMTASSSLGELTRDMVVVGLGLGMLQPVLTLAVQNAIPRTRLGVGTGAVTYLRALGQTVGTAVIGAVVANQFSHALASRLPAAAKQLPPQAVAAATNQQVLTSPQYRAALTQEAVHAAVAKAVPPAVAAAVAEVPHGANYAARVAAVKAEVTAQVTQQVTAEVTSLLNAIFEATRQALAVGITSSFWVALVVCGVIFVLTLFLKDVPLVKSFAPAPAAAATGNAPTGGMVPGAPGMGIGAVPASPRVPAGLPAGAYAAHAEVGAKGGGATAATSGGRYPPAEMVRGLGGASDGRARERLALAGIMLASIADEALRPDASPELLAGLAALADGRYPPALATEERGRAVARDLLEPAAMTALRTAYGEKLTNPAPGAPTSAGGASQRMPLRASLGRDVTDEHLPIGSPPPIADVEPGTRRAVRVTLPRPEAATLPSAPRRMPASGPRGMMDVPHARLVPSSPPQRQWHPPAGHPSWPEGPEEGGWSNRDSDGWQRPVLSSSSAGNGTRPPEEGLPPLPSASS